MPTYYSPFEEWIVNIISLSLSSVIGLLILISELKQRRKSSTSFTTKWMKIFSLSCIICCVTYSLFAVLAYIPLVCTVSVLMRGGSLMLLFMGFYQISRLYYCFSNEQVHSQKGYSKCTFRILIASGIFIFINFMTASTLTWTPKKCGYNDQADYYREYIATRRLPALQKWYLVSLIFCALWDMITLLLYIKKVRSFNKYKIKPVVYKRIIYILQEYNSDIILSNFNGNGINFTFFLIWLIRRMMSSGMLFSFNYTFCDPCINEFIHVFDDGA